MESPLSKLRTAWRGSEFKAPFRVACVIAGLCAASAIGFAAARQPAESRPATGGAGANPAGSVDPRETRTPANGNPFGGDSLNDFPDLAMAVATLPSPARVSSVSAAPAAAPDGRAAAANVAAVPSAAKPGHRVRVISMEVTAYCPCSKCCGKGAHGVTASGKPVSYNGGSFAAADTDLLPFETKIEIPGYNGAKPIEVIDRGGAIKGHKLDVFFPTHKQALEWGRRKLAVTIVD